MNPLFNHYASKLDLTLLQYEAVCALANSLFEDVASTAKHKTKRAIRNALPAFNNMFDTIARDNESNPILTERGNTQTVIEYLEHNVRNTFFHDGTTSIKFEPGAARIAYGELGMQLHEDTRKLTLLNKILKEISIAHETEYDSNLNGMTFDELKERFGASIQKADAETEKRLTTKTYSKSDYIIEWIPDFKTAQQYRQYTDYGNPNERWCLTHDETMWENYTGQHNENKVYFCHVPNFESVPRETGPNTPLDTYGLSLISVIVMPDKHLRAVTCRWNHTHGGSDGVMNQEQLSDLLGGYVFNICPPYSREEVIKRGYIFLDEVQQMLDEGVDLSEHIDNAGRIRINDKMNVVLHGKLVSDKWFDFVDNFANGFFGVELDDKWNFIDTEGNIISDKWFDRVNKFANGFAGVQLDYKWNLIDTEGNMLSDNWFDEVCDFSNGFVRVKLDRKWNLIDTEGNMLFDNWFDRVDYFVNGFARVKLNGKWNLIDTEGNMLSDNWFDGVGDFVNGFAVVELNGKTNCIDTEGKLLSDQWFDNVDTFANGFARVKLNGEVNFIDTEGNMLSDKWFDMAYDFVNGFALVHLDTKINFIDTEGNIISDKWFDGGHYFSNGFAGVALGEKWNFIDTEGNIRFNRWFDYVSDFFNGFAKVELNGKTNFIDTEGKLLSDQWFDNVDYFSHGLAKVQLNGKTHFIDTKGNIRR